MESAETKAKKQEAVDLASKIESAHFGGEDPFVLGMMLGVLTARFCMTLADRNRDDATEAAKAISGDALICIRTMKFAPNH